MKAPTHSKRGLVFVAMIVGSLVLLLGALTSLQLGLGPVLPVKILLGLSGAVAFVSWMLAVPEGEQAEGGESESEGEWQRPGEQDQLFVFRRAQFSALGLSDEIAASLATHPTVSVHDMARLIAKGCPPTTAVRILWPV